MARDRRHLPGVGEHGLDRAPGQGQRADLTRPHAPENQQGAIGVEAQGCAREGAIRRRQWQRVALEVAGHDGPLRPGSDHQPSRAVLLALAQHAAETADQVGERGTQTAVAHE